MNLKLLVSTVSVSINKSKVITFSVHCKRLSTHLSFKKFENFSFKGFMNKCNNLYSHLCLIKEQTQIQDSHNTLCVCMYKCM